MAETTLAYRDAEGKLNCQKCCYAWVPRVPYPKRCPYCNLAWDRPYDSVRKKHHE